MDTSDSGKEDQGSIISHSDTMMQEDGDYLHAGCLVKEMIAVWRKKYSLYQHVQDLAVTI